MDYLLKSMSFAVSFIIALTIAAPLLNNVDEKTNLNEENTVDSHTTAREKNILTYSGTALGPSEFLVG